MFEKSEKRYIIVYAFKLKLIVLQLSTEEDENG